MAVADWFRSRRTLIAERDMFAAKYDRTLQSERRMRARNKGQASGVSMSWETFTYESNTALTGSTRWDTLDQMENDPHVKGVLRSIILPLQNAEWDYQPASDSTRDEEIAEFCNANLLRKSGDKYGREYWTETSWHQRLFEILQCLRDGFSIFHFTFRRQGGKVVYDRIHWLEPSSMDPQGWELDDNDRLVAIKRTYSTPRFNFLVREPVPVNELALYPWDFKGIRLEGRPLIRSMYGAWRRKIFVQTQAAIWAQKVGAPVPVGFYPHGWPPEMVSQFEDFMESTRGESPAESWGAFEMQSDGQKPEFDYIGGALDVERGMTSLVDSENAEIAHGGGTKTEMLGETETGSRALGMTQSQREMVYVQAVASMVTEYEMHGVANLPGLMERLVDLNFANVKQYPRLTVSKINPHEDLDTIEQLVQAKNAGLIPSHPDLKKQVTERFGFTLPEGAYEQEEMPMLPGMRPGMQPGNGENGNGDAARGNGPEDGGEQGDESRAASRVALETADAFKRRIAPLLAPAEEDAPGMGAGFRRPTKLEARVVNLAVVNETHRVGERDLLVEFRRMRQGMVDDLLGRFRAGKITPETVQSQRRSQYKGFRGAKAALRRVFKRIGRAGMEHVQEEVERQ